MLLGSASKLFTDRRVESTADYLSSRRLSDRQFNKREPGLRHVQNIVLNVVLMKLADKHGEIY